MTTWTALTTLTDKPAAETLAEAVETLDPAPTGVGVFEVEDGTGTWEIGAYFTEAPDEIALALLAAAKGAKPFAVSALPETDWVAQVKRELAPIRAGRFFLYGAHDAEKVPDDVVPLLIEAAMAFGTGHHGTTQGCLQVLHDLDTAGVRAGNVADIGCGTAVLAMAAAKIWPGVMLASDIDPVATEVAEANARANDLEGRLRILTCAGFDHADIAARAPFDLVFANILKGPLVALAPQMADSTADWGHVVLSGILNEQAEEVKATYTDLGFTPVDHLTVGDWSTLCLQKRG